MRLRMSRVIASATASWRLLGCSISYGGWALSDDAAAVVARAAGGGAEDAAGPDLRRRRPGTIEQVQKAADELQRTADEAVGPNPAPRGVQRVQIEEPTINVRQYLTWGSAEHHHVYRSGRAGALLRVLPAGVRRPVQAQAGEARRTVAGEEEGHGADSRRDQHADRGASCSSASSPAWSSASSRGSLFRMFGLEQAGVWGVAAGVFNSIPYFGPDHRGRRHGGRRLPAVRHARDGATSPAHRSRSPASRAGC